MRLLFVARSNATLLECVRSETHLIPPISLRLMVLGALAVAYAGTACRPATKTTAAAPVSVDTWAVVDGREISREDVDKSYRRTRDTAPPVSDEETLTAKLSLLDDLILQDILLAKARTLKLDAWWTGYVKIPMPPLLAVSGITYRSLTVWVWPDGA